MDIELADHERFLELADQWENETVFLSRTDLATKHPAYREILDMGQLAIPLILEGCNRTADTGYKPCATSPAPTP